MRLVLVSLSKIVPSFGKSAFVPTSIGPDDAADGAEVGASAAIASSQQHEQAAAAATTAPAAITKSRRFRSDIRFASPVLTIFARADLLTRGDNARGRHLIALPVCG